MKAPEYIYNAIVENVVDGDTVDCLVDLGFNATNRIRFRIKDDEVYFDTPETWRPKTEAEEAHGEAAKARTIELLEGNRVVLKSAKKGKYRYVAEIFLEDGRSYTDLMISEGFQKREKYD